jgi:DNA-binding transcriptional ArsR family regulator
MTGKSPTDGNSPTGFFSALSDPVRWSIIAQAAQVDELACVTLEGTLPVGKPTISYHVKILQNAGLITTRKEGRNYYYSLRRDVLAGLIDDLWTLAPTPRPVIDGKKGSAPLRRAAERPDAAVGRTSAPLQLAVNDDGMEEAILTW